jgi:drug/metabolite transporter (DMT)-like permease
MFRGAVMKAMLLGILAAFFFSFTFLLNRMMEVEGGSWLFSASLRFLFMLPFLLVIVYIRTGFKALWLSVRKNPFPWFGWSFVGFVLFYAPLTFASGYAPGWLVAGTFQLTIVAGLLLSPLFYHVSADGSRIRQTIPLRSLFSSAVIFVGVVFIQAQHATSISGNLLFSVAPVIVAAFAYPLGNRKMMELTDGRIDTFSRVLGMTVMTTPVWVALFAIGTIQHGLPTASQTGQALIVAISSGIIATLLFFYATDRTRKKPNQLAAVEATQSGEVVFALILELLFLQALFPSPLALLGIGLIVIGMVLHSFPHTENSTARFGKSEAKQ